LEFDIDEKKKIKQEKVKFFDCNFTRDDFLLETSKDCRSDLGADWKRNPLERKVSSS
jgi:hypothetical protein